ncbi:MAG: GIY-YIG nuclease family protein [Clostridia bacterium]|nr:GIY-YIG nuclease family protein [Clostridia bacterium]
MYFIYILTNVSNKVMYVGVTNDLRRRITEHKQGLCADNSFTKRYRVTKLVYFESFPDPQTAIRREKQLKHWAREKKDNLVSDFNSNWEDLFNKLPL